jgi:hypothetical protein
LRAPDEWRKPTISDRTSGGQGSVKNDKADTRGSSNAAEAGTKATSPLKKNNSNKRKAGATTQVYRRVVPSLLQIEPTKVVGEDTSMVPYAAPAQPVTSSELVEEVDGDRDPKKNKPTPTNSDNMAVAVMQPCQEQ